MFISVICQIQEIRFNYFITIYYIEKKNLLKYTTQSGDVKKGISRRPTGDDEYEFDRMANRIIKRDDNSIRRSMFTKNFNQNFKANSQIQQSINQNIMEENIDTFDYQPLYTVGDFWFDLKQIENITLLGQGTSSKVFFIQDKCEKYYVIKTITSTKFQRQHFLQDNQQVQLKIRNYKQKGYEEELLMAMYAKQTYIFILNFYQMGDLFFHIQRSHISLEDNIKNIFCQLLLIIEQIHSEKSYHGDLRPENMLVDNMGYLVLTSFGKIMLRNPYFDDSYITTQIEYLPPEQITQNSLQQSIEQKQNIDFWQLGILLYELSYGCVPFCHEDQQVLCYMIKNSDIFFPMQELDKRSTDYHVFELLDKNVNCRLNSISAIKEHAWLQKFEWSVFDNKDQKQYLGIDIDPFNKLENFDKYFISKDNINFLSIFEE